MRAGCCSRATLCKDRPLRLRFHRSPPATLTPLTMRPLCGDCSIKAVLLMPRPGSVFQASMRRRLHRLPGRSRQRPPAANHPRRPRRPPRQTAPHRQNRPSRPIPRPRPNRRSFLPFPPSLGLGPCPPLSRPSHPRLAQGLSQHPPFPVRLRPRRQARPGPSRRRAPRRPEPNRSPKNRKRCTRRTSCISPK